MNPRFALGCVAVAVLPLTALLLIKSVLRMVDLFVAEELVFCSNRVGHGWSLEQVEKSAVGDDFTLEDSVES